jgi:membrane protease YdiL (CAAX protease family)
MTVELTTHGDERNPYPLADLGAGGTIYVEECGGTGQARRSMHPMSAIGPKEVLVFFLGWILLVILLGIGASWIGVIWNLMTGQRILPERPLVERRKIPWSSGTVLIVFLVYLAANILAFQGYLWATGATPEEKPALEPAIPVAKTAEKKDSANPEKAGSAEPVDPHVINLSVTIPSAEKAGTAEPGDVDRTGHRDTPAQPPSDSVEARRLTLIEMMSVQAAVNAFLVVFLPMVLRGTSGARLRDLGLSLDRWQPQVVLGVVSVLMLMPFIYGAQYIAVYRLGRTQHPLEQMLREQFSIESAVLSFLAAVVLAPLIEEMLFRGIFQSWLVELLNRSWSIAQGLFVSELVPIESSTLTQESDQSASLVGTMDVSERDTRADDFADEQTDRHPLIQDWPSDLLEVGAPVPDAPKAHATSPVCAAIAIVITSLLFAGLHAGQWPAPIPIFILALGLGFIYHRTGSLLAPICMHALFNGFSTLALFIALLMGVPGEAEKEVLPPAAEHKAPVEKVKSVVPGDDSPPVRGKR